MSDPFAAALDAIPEGSSTGSYRGRRWRAVKALAAGGRAVKLQAWGAGGGFVSLNLYRLASGNRLRPCEMPEAEVRAFVLGYAPRPAPPAPGGRR